MQDTFEVIVLIGRPAAGKSEVIDYLKKLDVETRKKRLGIGAFEEIDDFPFVWETFEIDDILSKHGKERAFTTPDYYFKDHFVWNLFIERINLEFAKKLARDPDYLKKTTAIVEFARGGENAFKEAFDLLSDEILERAGIVYIKVSYEESCRKNRRRFDPKQADSILYHSLPDDKMEFYYRENDWDKLAKGDDGHISIKGHSVPFSIFHNEPEVTDKPEELGAALEDVFARLRKRMQEKAKAQT
ncbi:MAG: hypothetical protein JSW03_00725 [Candidatus Eiseniibacteriota bacterium]|nr:MAG: hypothetical protein JSW03_00725 [Candidatus Eisenbacteria bacterium]